MRMKAPPLVAIRFACSRKPDYSSDAGSPAPTRISFEFIRKQLLVGKNCQLDATRKLRT